MEDINIQPSPPIMLAERGSQDQDEVRFANKNQKEQTQEEQMQQFLFQQILQQGYNGDDFRIYLKSKYPGAEEDLNKITMDQLKEVVTAFKLQSNPQIDLNKQNSNNDKLPVNDYSNNEYLTFDDPNQSQIKSSQINSNIRQSAPVSYNLNNNNNISVAERNRQASVFLNEKNSNPQQFAINKEILNEPQSNLKQNSAIKPSNSVSLTQSVYVQGQPQQQQPIQGLTQSAFPSKIGGSAEQGQGEDNLNQSILNSTFSQSRVIKDSQGQTILRKEAQIVPQTSLVKDNFIKKNLEGEETSKVISCKQIEATKVSEYYEAQQQEFEKSQKPIQKLKVVVDKYEVVFDGLFSSEYALYSVQTPIMEWNVSRRFNDFHWLYAILKKHYPGNFIPPIPKKTTIKEMSEEHLYQRMRSFEQFLNQILLCPTLSVSPYVSDFLSVIDQKAFEAKRKEHDLRQVPQIVDLITTVTGELTSEITPPLKEFWNQFSDLNQKSLLNYESLNENVDNMITSMRKAADESNKIAQQFARMHKSHQQYNKLSPLGKIPVLETMNIHLNSFFVDFATSIYDMTVAFEKNVFEYTRFSKLMYEEYKTTIQYQTEQQNNYLEALKKLNTKKEKLFQQSNTSKWELDKSCELTIRELQYNKVEALKYMIPTETKAVQDKGEYFGYINKQLYEDVIMHLAASKDILSNRFISLSQDLALEINKLHIRTAECNMKFADLLGQKNSSLNQRYRPE